MELEGGEKDCFSHTDFEELFQRDASLGEARNCPKLTKKHLSTSNMQRQRVFLASQLFSGTVAKELHRQGKRTLAKVVEDINNW